MGGRRHDCRLEPQHGPRTAKRKSKDIKINHGLIVLIQTTVPTKTELGLVALPASQLLAALPASQLLVTPPALQSNFIQQKDDVIISNQDKGHYSSFAPTCVFLWCPLPSAFPVATRVGGQARRGCKVTSRVHTFQKCSFHSSTTKVIRVTRVELCSPRLSLRGSAMSLDQTGLENGHRWSSQVRK